MNTVDDHTFFATLANGVRVLVLRTPQRRTLELSVFVHTGSQHESARDSGISHMVEHMAFKGSATRDCQRINLDAEMLGAQVNAHTDKDHSAFHMSGLADDAVALLRMLADIVLTPTFPADELERERQVILHEYLDDEDDLLSVAFRLFDKGCWGAHALALPVIGTRRNIERFTRDELRAYVQRQYTGANLLVAVAGDVDAQAIAREAERCFGALPHGAANQVAAPLWHGGLSTRTLSGTPQTHAVLGFPIPGLGGAHTPAVVAAALLGDGMSSPLMDELRERRGLVYYAACSADVLELAGQFVIEASTSPQRLDEFFAETQRLLLAHAQAVDAAQLARARRQLLVRHLRRQDQPAQRLEQAALELFATGRVRRSDEQLEALQSASADAVREAFARMLEAGAAIAVAGKLPRGAGERLRKLARPLLRAPGTPERPPPGRRRHFGARTPPA
ncbi:MAG TPA: pitrilysin family protein [Rubrivivax sp.]|nr:pitrilysin family protein [Rubrivivax sp.]